MTSDPMNNVSIKDDQIESMSPNLGAYHILRRQVIRSKRALMAANDSEEVKKAWENIKIWAKASAVCEDLKNVWSILKDLLGTMNAAEQSGNGHSNVVEVLEALHQHINAIIALENWKSKVELLRAICLYCAEHAEEIAEFVNLDEIFCD